MSPLQLAGKLAVVTGASSGLGREIALSLALDEKAHVVVAARRRDRLEALKAEIESRSSSHVYVVEVDLSQPDAARALFERSTALGRVDALVNCAGMTFYGRTLDTPMDVRRKILAVNQMAVMDSSLLFLRYFLDRGGGGILTITSVYGQVPGPYQNEYAASKHAVQIFMEGLAGEYRRCGVTISTAAVGGMDTEMVRTAGLTRGRGPRSLAFLDLTRTARAAITSFKRGRLVTVPGALYKVVVFLRRVTTRKFGLMVSEKVMRPKGRP